MKESELQVRIAEYIRRKYPSVLFHSDFGSGVKMTQGQAIRQKRQNGGLRGWPDMFIAEPRMFYDAKKRKTIQYHGLFIELKKDGTRILKKDGTPASKHIEEQLSMLDALGEKGYRAIIAIGFETAKDSIDHYLKGSME